MNEEEPPSPRANSSFFIISSSLKKRSSRPVSRVLYPVKLGTPVIYLVRLSPSGFSGLPSDMERLLTLTAGLLRRRFFSSALLHPRGQLSVRKWDALCCPDFPPVPRKAQATGRPTASPGTKVRKVGGVAKGCRKSLSKLSRQVLVKSLFIPYPSLIPLLFLSYSSLIPLLFLSYPSLIPLLSLSYSFLSPPFHLRFRSVLSSFGNAGGMGPKWES